MLRFTFVGQRKSAIPKTRGTPKEKTYIDGNHVVTLLPSEY